MKLVHAPILITGAASGIGRATARLLSAQGAQLTLWDINAQQLIPLAQELNTISDIVDVSNAEQVASAMQRLVARTGALHTVIHTAGILHAGQFMDLPLAEQMRMVQINLGGTIAIAHAALPHLRVSRGNLILMGSSSAFYGTPEFAAYGATKAGVLSLVEALRSELAGSGVQVGVVNPLFVDTPMLGAANRQAKLFRRFGITTTPDQVAQAIFQQGVLRRRRYIWPEWRPRLLFWASRSTYPLLYPVMRFLSR